MRPNLFIVGAPKCGTTAWVEYLGSHPDIFFAEMKEPHHFSRDFPKWNFISDLDEYLSLFSESGNARVIGEGSVRYLYSKVAAREIRKFNPAAKILIFLRSQEDFLPSLHNQQLYNRDESIEDFSLAWRLSGQRSVDTIPSCCREPSFLDYAAMGRFHEQVERYYDVFPPEQIRVITFAEWVSDPRPVYLQILDFLGLEDDGRTTFAPVNEAKHHKSKLVASVTQIPPPWVRRSSAILTRLAGRQLGIVSRLREMNRAKGYRQAIDTSLKEEIRQYYASDNRLLRDRIGAHLGGVR